ncbi:hypothetical protein DEO72_LG6g1416 [Vigna unguiculata]|uniref:Uncharacterized protein n=1 Tax=Vigna unguiculata TaxID=3917 RepID=A0A4D6M875_VIGUN|nr:hypothetical protein DEO72_LG6g1416 [Vigna unguiculata]
MPTTRTTTTVCFLPAAGDGEGHHWRFVLPDTEKGSPQPLTSIGFIHHHHAMAEAPSTTGAVAQPPVSLSSSNA